MQEPLRARDLLQVIRRELRPWFRHYRFHRIPATHTGWFALNGARYFVMKISHSQAAYPDPFAGSQFRVDVGASDQPTRDDHAIRNMALYLEEYQLAHLLKVQNQVISALPDLSLFQSAPGEHIHPKIRPWYLRLFQPVTKFGERLDNVFLRYRTELDASQWAVFISEAIPSVMHRLREGEPPLWD